MTNEMLAVLLSKYLDTFNRLAQDVDIAVKGITLSDAVSGAVAQNRIFKAIEGVQEEIEHDIAVLTEKKRK